MPRAWLPRAGLLAAYGLLALALATPVLLSDIPIGVDTLNHFARIHVRAHIDTDPDLARLFEVRHVLLPYLGMDWLLTPMAQVWPTLSVARGFEVALVWGLVGAVAVLSRVVTGRFGPEPLAAGLMAYSAPMAWGFLNYQMGVIEALLAFAAWIAWRDRPWLWRLLVFSVFCAGLYLTHLLALAAYGLMVGAYELFGARNAWQDWLRRGLVMAGQFTPAALLWLSSAVPLPAGDPGITFEWHTQLTSLASPFLFVGAPGDVDTGYVVLVLCLIFAVGFTRLGVLQWEGSMLRPALVLLVLSAAMPTAALGIFATNLRLPPIAFCLALAAVRVRPAVPVRQWAPLAMWLAVLLLVQTGAVASEMTACDPDMRELRAALAELPRGTVIMNVQERSGPGGRCARYPFYEHMGELITIDRSGYSEDFFGDNTSVASRLYPANVYAPGADFTDPARLSGIVLWMHMGVRRPVMQELTMLHDGSFFSLLRATPPAPGPTPSQ